ncbi:MAG: hypothetical protein QNJ15_13555 [Erythrobacter sp.]|nr:hypothetical protein [Erythrobacter sp.]
MFGFNRKKPAIEGPIEFSLEAEIGRPASEVYRLIDVADPGFRQVLLGHSVAPVVGDDNCFDMVLNEMPDVTFHLRVVEAVRNRRLQLECTISPTVGNLRKSVETHIIEPRGDDACHITLVTEATFSDGLSDGELAEEIAMMSAAVHNDLIKLAIHAEDGTDAVLRFEEEQWS